jgi:hypothetical protein
MHPYSPQAPTAVQVGADKKKKPGINKLMLAGGALAAPGAAYLLYKMLNGKTETVAPPTPTPTPTPTSTPTPTPGLDNASINRFLGIPPRVEYHPETNDARTLENYRMSQGTGAFGKEVENLGHAPKEPGRGGAEWAIPGFAAGVGSLLVTSPVLRNSLWGVGTLTAGAGNYGYYSKPNSAVDQLVEFPGLPSGASPQLGAVAAAVPALALSGDIARMNRLRLPTPSGFITSSGLRSPVTFQVRPMSFVRGLPWISIAAGLGDESVKQTIEIAGMNLDQTISNAAQMNVVTDGLFDAYKLHKQYPDDPKVLKALKAFTERAASQILYNNNAEAESKEGLGIIPAEYMGKAHIESPVTQVLVNRAREILAKREIAK